MLNVVFVVKFSHFWDVLNGHKVHPRLFRCFLKMYIIATPYSVAMFVIVVMETLYSTFFLFCIIADSLAVDVLLNIRANVTGTWRMKAVRVILFEI